MTYWWCRFSPQVAEPLALVSRYRRDRCGHDGVCESAGAAHWHTGCSGGCQHSCSGWPHTSFFRVIVVTGAAAVTVPGAAGPGGPGPCSARWTRSPRWRPNLEPASSSGWPWHSVQPQAEHGASHDTLASPQWAAARPWPPGRLS